MKRTRLVIDGRTVRDQPPVVGDYCWPGSSGKVDRPCFYESASCGGIPSVHERCGFSFCANHYSSHIRTLPAMPPDFFRGLMTRTRAALKTIAVNPRAHMPYIEVSSNEAGRGANE